MLNIKIASCCSASCNMGREIRVRVEQEVRGKGKGKGKYVVATRGGKSDGVA